MDFEEVNEGEGPQEIDGEMNEMEDIFGGAGDPQVYDQGSKKDAVVFLIDCKPCLFKILREDKETQMTKILTAFQSFLKSKIISNVDDKIGLVFYNIKKDNNPLNFKNINLVYNLDSPSADKIKQVLTIEKDFEQNYGFSHMQAALHECLWLCNHEFKTLDKNKYSMRIFLFTCEDQPLFKDQNSKDQTIKHARQLKDMEVQIELFPLYKDNDHNFSINKFYSEIITVDLDEINNSVLDTTQKIMDLKSRIKQKEYRKRALNRILMDIGDFQIGLKIYCLVNKARKPLGKPIERKTNSQLKKKTQFVCNDTGNPLYPNQIGTYFPLGNEKIPLTKDEMNKIKSIEGPGMRLIGFKPMSALKDFHNYRTSYFTYPDDEHVNGSSQFFDALINQMTLKQKLAIVRLVPRVGSTVRFCALLPQQESYDEDHFQKPPGMHLIFLPYADDIRELQQVKQQGSEVSRELLNITKIMANALTIQDFDCTNFEDPSIQKFFAHLQGHALGEQQIDEPEDLLQPDWQGMEKYQDIINLYQQAVDLECNEFGYKKGGRGRGSKKQMEEECDDTPKAAKRGRGRGRGN